MDLIGRAKIPLIFMKEGEEVIVKDIKNLKEFWKAEHLEKLIEYLHDGRLEQFFFASRKDEISNMIKSLKKDKKSDLDILNEVGKTLSFNTIEAEKVIDEKLFINKDTGVEDIFTPYDRDIKKLLPGEWQSESFHAKIDRFLKIEVSGKEKTLLKIKEITIGGEDKLEIENLQFKNEEREGVIKVESGEVIFKNVSFSGVKIQVTGGKVVTEECYFEHLDTAIEVNEKGSYESMGNIDFYNIPKESQIRFRGQTLSWHKDITLNFEKITEISLKSDENIKKIIENLSENEILKLNLMKYKYDLDGFQIKNKKIKIIGEEGAVISGSIVIEDSDITFENIKFDSISAKRSKVMFKECDGGKIFGKSSEITIKDSEIHGNEGNGIYVIAKSILRIKDSKIYENGTEGKSYPQIWIEDSTAEIENTEIYNSIGGEGIYIYDSKSKVKLENVKTWANKVGVICSKDGTTVKIKNCEFKDGIDGNCNLRKYK